ncbi:TonB-dependent receptor plug domain-containing protein [Caulobacter sp. NIBR2454]|uniref:TonB-dependent receptor plug domain-containing protein n=1 Tax=Caulobacter sp. NIBR2454 TaxID=3015996 RepID=UPI0022B6F676|nr:TonB-dependent receptor [Caulobacter sp. NIBR2454]
MAHTYRPGASLRVALLATSLFGGLAAADVALAQDDAATVEEIVITGTRIRSANVESVSPIVQIGGEEFAQRGTTRTEDLVNALPQVFAAQGAAASNEATGTAQVDLRGLTPSRTLVLVNGRRLPYGSPKSTPSDLNQVPAALIKNVEVLTGGASAVYGSDAIAGVVNFTLLDNFEGIKLGANFSTFQHNNNRDGLRDLLDVNNARVPGGYLKPDSSVWNGFTQDYSVIMGANSGDGEGNITAYATYRKVDAILQKDFDYSACALGTTGPNGSQYSCSGSGFNSPANFSNTAGLTGVPTSFRSNNGSFAAGTQTFNFAPFNYYQRPDQRYTLGAIGHYKLNDMFEPYFEVGFMDDRSTAQIAPGTVSGGINGSAGGVNCDNPLLSAQQASFLCTAAGLSTAGNYDASGAYLGPQGVANGIVVSRRNVEGGTRQDDIRHTTFRLVGGVRGQINEAFSYDLFGSYANVSYRSRFAGDANQRRVANALNAVVDRRTGSATNGRVVCAINADANSGNDDANCAPLDYFGANASSAAIDYIAESKGITGDTSLTDIVFSVSGDLGQYGFTSPMATNGVGVAFGAEYRKNTLDLVPDEAYRNAVSPEYPVNGTTSAKELFAEINAPLIEDRPGIRLLSFEGAYRYSDYNTGFKTDAFKAGLNWSPMRELRLRGSYQRAVRAPNVVELFSSQTLFEAELTELANGLYDPCAGATPFATLEQCQRTGVSAAQYGRIIDNPAGQFNSLIGGNADLNPETADTYSLGLVAQPGFIPGLTVSVDYFNIKVSDLIGSVNPGLAMSNCLANGDPYFCGLINRGPGGTLWLTDEGYFRRFNLNTGSLKTSGVDLSIDYRLDLANLGMETMGSVNLNMVGTWLDKYETQPLPNSPEADVYECSGLYAGLCGRPRPEWRHKLLASWKSPWNVEVNATWRYVSSVKIAQTSSQPALSGSFAQLNEELGARSYFDLSAAYDVRDGVSLRVGVNNLFDKDPPLTTTAAIEDGGNGNTYPQFYDATGRYLFGAITVAF